MPSAQYYSAEHRRSVRADEPKDMCPLVYHEIPPVVSDVIARVIFGISYDVDPADCSWIFKSSSEIVLLDADLRLRATQAMIMIDKEINNKVHYLVGRVIKCMSHDVDPADHSIIIRDRDAIAVFDVDLFAGCAQAGRVCCETIRADVAEALEKLHVIASATDRPRAERVSDAIALFDAELRSKAVQAGRVCCEAICNEIHKAHEKMYAYEDAQSGDRVTVQVERMSV
jgi:hypothetical protein